MNPRRILRAIRDRFCMYVQGFVVMWIYVHDLASIPSVQAPENCAISLLTEDQATALKDLWVDEATVRRRLGRGDLCYVASLGDRIAHCSWVQRSGSHSISWSGKAYPIAPGEYWIYNCVTPAWARGRGLYPLVLCRILEDRKRAGGTRAWIYTTTDNVPSQRGILRAGFRRVSQLRSFAICQHALLLKEYRS
jgi:hypothetical protein